MKAHIFLIITPKFQLQIHYTLKVIAKNVTFSVVPISILCIFITASSPVSHTYFCPRRENKKQPWYKIVQSVSQGSRSISWEWKILMSKWSHPPNFFVSSNKNMQKVNFAGKNVHLSKWGINSPVRPCQSWQVCCHSRRWTTEHIWEMASHAWNKSIKTHTLMGK